MFLGGGGRGWHPQLRAGALIIVLGRDRGVFVLRAACVAVDTGLNSTGRARCAPELEILVFVGWVWDECEINAGPSDLGRDSSTG